MKKNYNILGTIKKIPAGLMLIPMLITAVLNTFCPWTLQIGNPHTAMFTSYGTPVLIGISLFVTGTQISLAQLPICLKRCGIPFFVKIAEAFLVCSLAAHFLGENGIFGISSLALMICFSSCNPGIYLALVNTYGDEIDEAGYGLYNIIGSPLLATVAVCSTAGRVDYMSVIAILVPFCLGFLLGNLDGNIRRFMAPGNAIILPFMGFTFGASINLVTAVKAGGAGILLSILYVAVNFIVMLFVDRAILKRPGYAGSSLGAVAGVAVAVPAMVAETLPQYEPYISVATAQIATALVISSITTPILTKLVVDRFGCAKERMQQ